MPPHVLRNRPAGDAGQSRCRIMAKLRVGSEPCAERARAGRLPTRAYERVVVLAREKAQAEAPRGQEYRCASQVRTAP
jgi:hypothetical protein